MTIKLLRAAMTATLLLGAASFTAYAADSKPKVSAAVGKQLQVAQKAITAKDFPAALAAMQAAQQISDRTPYDDLWINKFMMSTQINLKDMAAADVAAEAAADMDPAVIPDDEKAGVYKPALQLALNNKRYDKAAKYAKLYLATTPPPPAADQALAAQAMYLGGDYAGATALAQKNIDAAKAAGQKPARNDLDIIMSSQVKAKDQVGAEATLELLVANYNMPEDWAQVLGVTLGNKGMRDLDYVYVGRLWPLTGAKMPPTDASLVGNTASRLAFYGDAVAAQKFGGTGFPPADAKADADKKTIPAQIAAGAKQNGQYNVKLAQALYGYGMYAEAETAAKLAQTKGGATDPTEAPMVIGMAQTAQGKYADAAASFGQINSANPASQRVVRLWTMYVQTKTAPATAAAAPAPAAAQ